MDVFQSETHVSKKGEQLASEEIFEALAQSVIDGDPEEAAKLAQKALDMGLDPLVCIDRGLTRGIQKVGELFAEGVTFLPDLIFGGEAMSQALAILEPALLGRGERAVLGRIVIGTAKGDLHEIGKTLVGTMLTANGFQVIDLGIDKSADDFIKAVNETGAEIVGISALLTTTMREQKKAIEAFKTAGIRDKVKVIVGGAPVTQDWADDIGADGFAEDAVSAVDLVKRLLDAPA